jgi:hypothetical protein
MPIMKKLVLLFIAFSMAAGSFAQDKAVNDPNAQKRSVSGFRAISVSGGIDLFLTQSSEEAVAVSASKEEYVNKIKTVVENGVLKMYYDSDNWFSWGWSSRKLKAYVSVKTLEGLTGSGGSDILVSGQLNVAALDLDLSGGSDFRGTINATSLDLDLSGGSDANISGRTGSLVVDASGGSDVNAFGLSADTCVATCSGGSDINVTVNKELSASASGGSDVHYRGNATIKKNSSSGGGSVSKRS